MLRDAYDSYVTTVSPPAMALSWEALEAISEVLSDRNPKRILEYGSGISTYLLASYGRQIGSVIQSYDSDQEWTEKTLEFLRRYELDSWASVQYSDLVEPEAPADFVLWDFDKNPKRVDLMNDAYANLCDGGVMYVDDTHSREIANAMHKLRGNVLRIVPRDGFGRYGVFIGKPMK